MSHLAWVAMGVKILGWMFRPFFNRQKVGQHSRPPMVHLPLDFIVTCTLCGVLGGQGCPIVDVKGVVLAVFLVWAPLKALRAFRPLYMAVT